MPSPAPAAFVALAALAAAAALPALPASAQTGAAPLLPPAVVEQALTLSRQAAEQLAPPGARIDVSAGSLNPRLRLAPCRRIEAHLAAGTPAWGRTRVGLRCAEGAVAWNVSLPVTVQVMAPALVARSTLPAGSEVQPDQFIEAEVDWGAGSTPPLTGADDFAGRQLTRPLAAGQPLRGADLRTRQWFSAGDTVRIVAVGQGFSISSEGQAMSHGIEGRSARVRMPSGRIVSGDPVGERRVEVAP